MGLVRVGLFLHTSPPPTGQEKWVRLPENRLVLSALTMYTAFRPSLRRLPMQSLPQLHTSCRRLDLIAVVCRARARLRSYDRPPLGARGRLVTVASAPMLRVTRRMVCPGERLGVGVWQGFYDCECARQNILKNNPMGVIIGSAALFLLAWREPTDLIGSRLLAST